jgi:hypothetical protein
VTDHDGTPCKQDGIINHILAKTVPNGTIFLSMSSEPIQANGKYPKLNNNCPYANSVIAGKILIDLYP